LRLLIVGEMIFNYLLSQVVEKAVGKAVMIWKLASI